MFCAAISFAQNPVLNHNKYWFYRYKLTNLFMHKGEQACGQNSGYDIPGSVAYDHGFTSDDPGAPKLSRITFSDGTSQLGFYIGVLATEYRLLVANGQTTDANRTLNELYYAFKAYERLDKNAETLNEPLKSTGRYTNCEANLNGFFQRNDMEPFSLDGTDKAGDPNLPTNYNSWTKTVFLDQSPKKYDGTPLRNFKVIKNGGEPFMSQDQIADLMIGFALVVKCLDDNTSYNGYNFKVAARTHTNNMMSYMRGKQWVIRNPDNNAIGSYSLGMLPFSYGFAWAGDKIVSANGFGTDKIFESSFDFINTGKDPYTSIYEGSVETTASFPYWDGLKHPNGDNIWTSRFNDGAPEMISPALLAASGMFTAATLLGALGTEFKLPANNHVNAIVASTAAIGNSWRVGIFPTKVFDGASDGIPYFCCTKCCYSGFLQDWYDVGDDFHDVGDDIGSMTKDVGSDFSNFRLETLGCSGSYRPCGDCGYKCSISIPISIYCYQENVSEYMMAILVEKLGLGVFGSEASKVMANLGSKVISSLCAPSPLPGVSYNVTGSSLSYYGNNYNVEIYTLLHRILHNGKGDYTFDPNKFRSNILNTAPCNGPHHFGSYDPFINPTGGHDEGASGWRVDNRWEKNKESLYMNESYGSFNGLDYMLAYNLFRLNYNGENALYRDTRYENVLDQSYPKPQSDNYVGSHTYNPVNINGYENIVASNVTVANLANSKSYDGDLRLHAGKSIKLSNFKVQNGAYFKALGDPLFKCDVSTGALLRTEEPAKETAVQNLNLQNGTPEETMNGHDKKLEEAISKYQDEFKKIKEANSCQSLDEYLAKSNTQQATIANSYSKAYPNPLASNQPLNMEFVLSKKEVGTITLTNSLGNKVALAAAKGYGIGKSVLTFNSTDLSPGMYLLAFEGEENRFTHKILVVK